MCDDEETIVLLKQLTQRLKSLPVQEQSCCPSYLCMKKPRFRVDWSKVPLIMHSSIREIRPTHEIKRVGNDLYGPDVVYIEIDPSQNPNPCAPWYCCGDPCFI